MDRSIPHRNTKAGRSPAPATSTPPDTSAELARTMGHAIRTRRTELGLTMAELAERAGLSQPFLSKVERGVGRMSMAAIDRVARALGTSAVGLFAGPEPAAAFDVVRRDERLQVDAYDHGDGIGEALTRRSGQLRVIEFVGGPEEFADTPYVHRNDSVCVVLSGTYEFEFDGTRMILHDGDSLSASGGVAQRYRVLEKPARMMLILVSEDLEALVRPMRDWGTAPPG